jgi:hypothetical protein
VLVKVSPILAAFNPAGLLDQVRLKLVTHRSKLVAQSVSLAYGGFSIATDLVALEDELRFIFFFFFASTIYNAGLKRSLRVDLQTKVARLCTMQWPFVYQSSVTSSTHIMSRYERKGKNQKGGGMQRPPS